MKKISLLLMSIVFTGSLMRGQGEDPYQWLENVDDEKALEWVESMNDATIKVLEGVPQYTSIYENSLEIYNSSERIASPSVVGKYVYNFWQDADHVRGIWRRMEKKAYLEGSETWDILLDLDAMMEEDGVKWVFKGAQGLFPDYNIFLLNLSKGGGDATIKREFDVNAKKFVENGFELDESKGGASWLDKNTLLVSVDFGEGTMTTSGYPNQVKVWKRGTDLSEAKLVHEGNTTDVGSWGSSSYRDGKVYAGLFQMETFYTGKSFAWVDGKMRLLDLPSDANFMGVMNDQALVSLKSDWEVNGKTFAQGAIVSLDYQKLLKGEHDVTLIVKPDSRSSINSTSMTKNYLLINMLNNVKSELYSYSFDGDNWKGMELDAPELGTIRTGSTDDNSDDFFYYYTNFLNPSTLYYANAKTNDHRTLQSLPEFFDGSKYKVWQQEAKSKDGTMIPYFVVGPKEMKMDGTNPTLLYAYGGFESSSLPFYSATWGTAWLENGGTFVLANIRGGGEFGPAWHQAGLKEKRQNVYNDFHAVAEDLMTRKITNSDHLGIMGGSNGGLLVGVAFTQRPDLYNAVVCAVPLLDMKRYNKLLAGASWMGEYGNPDIPEEWEYISKYSPYHNVSKDTDYPEVFFTTSTRDDRVHPGHARKMAAKMSEMGHKVYYFENTEGGHAGSSTNDQRAKTAALEFSYLLMKLK
jgi:prolyl oligopeptidase